MRNTFKNIFIICSAVIILSLSSPAQSGTTQYVYDDNGRLTAVIAPNGETSVYEYDAAGNIVSITRQNSPVVSITSFGLTQEECASTETLRVTISGTGFVLGIAQNTVTFNGVAATVESVTQNEITAAIPQGFSAGSVRVSNVNGFAERRLDITSPEFSARITPNNSPRNFNIANEGQTLSLCFEGTASKNISLLLGNDGFTSLNIKITAPSGSVLISQNYSPSGGQIFIDSKLLFETGTYYVKLSSPVSQTGSLSVSIYEFEDLSSNMPTDGTPTSFSITKPGQNAKFQLTANGVSYNLSFQNSAISDYSIKIIRNSDGQVIKNIPSLPITLNGLIGNYTIIFDPTGTATGGAIFKVEPLTIRTDGTPEIISLSNIGESAGRNFSATDGQTFNLRVSNVTVRPSTVRIIKPDGEGLTSSFIDFYFTGAFLQFTVPTDGVYTVLFEPYFASTTGSGTFSLNLLNEATGSLIINNPATNFTSTVPGQAFRISFAGNQGQRFYLKKNTDDFSDLALKIINPDGTELLSRGISSNTVIDVNNLPVTGNYTIIAQPNFISQFGSLTLRAIDNNVFISNTEYEYINAYFYSDVVTDFSENPQTVKNSSGRQTIKNKETASESANLTVPTATYFYSGTANEQFSFAPYQSPQESRSLAGDRTMTVYKPDGTILNSAPLDVGICNISLPESGTYRIEVAPDGATQNFLFVKACGSGGIDPSLINTSPRNKFKKF